MLYELWPFRKKQEFLNEWKEVLIESDDEKLHQIFLEIRDHACVNKYPAYEEVANALILKSKTRKEDMDALRKRLRIGSDLSEASFSAVLKGKEESA